MGAETGKAGWEAFRPPGRLARRHGKRLSLGTRGHGLVPDRTTPP